MSTDTTTATETRRFEVGQVVDTGTGDYRWTFDVIKRTRCFVTLRDRLDGKTYRVGIKTNVEYGGSADEWALPFGSYSLAPVVNA